MRQPIFHRESKRTWTNGLGRTDSAIELNVYDEPRGGDFDIFVSSPAGYTVLKYVEDLIELMTFCGDAVFELRKVNKLKLSPLQKALLEEAKKLIAGTELQQETAKKLPRGRG